MRKNRIQSKNEEPLYGPHRWTYERESLAADVSEIGMFGFDHIRQAVSLGEHLHPQSYEFVFVQKGKVSWEIGDVTYQTRAGDVFHTKPDEMHKGSFSIVEPCQIYWLVLQAPDSRQEWLRLADEEAKAIGRQLQKLPRIVHTGIMVANEFRRLRDALTGTDLFRVITIRQSIMEILLTILRPQNALIIDDGMLKHLRILIEQMTRQPAWRPSIEQLAAMVNISTSHFYRLFQEYTGLTPMSYMERVRIEMACRRLKESNVSITQLSFDLGYQSSQHFATVFKRFTGNTPSSWRKRNLNTPMERR